MFEWKLISEAPPPKAMILLYCNHGNRRYCICCSEELPEVKVEYPNASHWKVITLAPAE